MARRRFGTFSGGIDLPDEKGATLNAPIVPLGRLERLAVPLGWASGPSARAVVSAGEKAARGALLARSGEGQVDVFAPLGGRVAGPARVALPGPDGIWRGADALELTDLDDPPDIEPLLPQFEWQAADAGSLRHRIGEGQLVTCDPLPRPLSAWLASAVEAPATTLIANVMENTHYVTSDHRLLAERGPEVVRGLAILARAMGIEDVMLAVDRRRTDAYAAAVEPARLYGVETIALSHKYPIGLEAVLVEVLTRREVPPGGCGLDVGAAVVSAPTCWAAFRWVACGERQTGRVVTLAGEETRRPGNFLVPFGAAAEDVLAGAGARAESLKTYGPAMTGERVAPAAVVGPGCDALLALHAPTWSSPSACIRCGWCVEGCPARLNVAALNDDFELGRADRAADRGALACLGCGICSYVCPARLPLARRVRLLKQAIYASRELDAHAGDAAHADLA